MAKERRALIGKVAAITGGAQGIGRATAEALVRKGCRVAIGDLDLKLAEETASALGGNAIALPLDVTDRASFESFLEDTERQIGPIDILVNNAGIMPVTRFIDESEESMRRQVDINLHGVLIGSQLAMGRMLPRRSGHIVNVASSAGKTGVPGIATYAATKHAVVGFSEAIKGELRDTGVDVSVVMPVLVNTALTEGLSEKRGVREVEPQDVANAIVEALELNRYDVFVPKSLGPTIAMGGLLPRRVREAVGRFMQVDKVMSDVTDRSAYEQRAAKSKREPDAARQDAEAEQAPEKQNA